MGKERNYGGGDFREDLKFAARYKSIKCAMFSSSERRCCSILA